MGRNIFFVLENISSIFESRLNVGGESHVGHLQYLNVYGNVTFFHSVITLTSMYKQKNGELSSMNLIRYQLNTNKMLVNDEAM